jgi:aminoglycoside phosphotransferase (APT) family kinase protein
VTNSNAVEAVTSALLLEALRVTIDDDALEYEEPPSHLSGGFYAEMIRFRLADPPVDLAGDLVARIIPSAPAGAWEATIQRGVADQGFPTPAVRLTAPETSPLGRYVIVMDLVDGRPSLAGLSIGSVLGRLPILLRDLPEQLAVMAAALHALDPEPLAAALRSLDTAIPTTTAGFVEQQATLARAVGRADIAAAGERLIRTQPASSVQVISHGDLHPFNVLVGPDGPVLIDWTVARIAHPGFTVGFTDLMLANPPIPVPGLAAPLLRPVGRTLSKRFLAAYRRRTDGTPAEVDDENLDWHRKVHALRILVELAGWDAAGARPTSGHPWLVLEPVAQRLLGVGA